MVLSRLSCQTKELIYKEWCQMCVAGMDGAKLEGSSALVSRPVIWGVQGGIVVCGGLRMVWLTMGVQENLQMLKSLTC